MSTTLGLDAARAVDVAGYAIGGRRPHAAVRPETREELSEVLRSASRDGLAVVPWGGGTSLARDRAPDRYDVALDLRGLARIVDYDPQDLTVTAECGITLESLRRTVAERGQELPVEGALPGRATLGGVLATNASGPRRLRFGSPRDRLLGARFALADGTIARSGGRVVKNVAGFALHRLLCGSAGGLAALVEASLKLLPAPADRIALVYPASAAELRDEARWAFLPRLEPSSATVLGGSAARGIAQLGDAEYAVVIGLEDDAAWVQVQWQRIEAALGRAAARFKGRVAEEVLQAVTEAAADGVVLTTAWNSPAALGVMLTERVSPGLVFHFLAGRLHLELGSEHSSAVQRLAGSGFVPVGADPGDSSDPAGMPIVLGELRRRIRTALDPGGVWALGSRWVRSP